MSLPETAIEVTEADNGDLFLRVLDEALDALGKRRRLCCSRR
jgi:hypothetical protein